MAIPDRCVRQLRMTDGLGVTITRTTYRIHALGCGRIKDKGDKKWNNVMTVVSLAEEGIRLAG